MFNRTAGWVLLVSVLMVVVPAGSQGDTSGSATTPSRTWKTVEEMTPEELQEVDLRTDTPRHPQLSYMPA